QGQNGEGGQNQRGNQNNNNNNNNNKYDKHENNQNNYDNNNQNNNQGSYKGKNFDPNYHNQKGRNEQNSNRNNNNQNGQQNDNWKKRRNQYWQPISGTGPVDANEVLIMFEAHTIQIATLAQKYALMTSSTGGYKTPEDFVEKHKEQIHDCKLFYIQGKPQDPSVTPQMIAQKIEEFLEQHAAFIYQQYLVYIPQTWDPSWRLLDFLIHIRHTAAYAWQPVINIEGVPVSDSDQDIVMVDDSSEYTTLLCQLCKFAPLPYLTVIFGLVHPDAPGHSY
ncbi:hypothetical protein QBC36DRAFT_145960, partial [Triangularia setosa]